LSPFIVKSYIKEIISHVLILEIGLFILLLFFISLSLTNIRPMYVYNITKNINKTYIKYIK